MTLGPRLRFSLSLLLGASVLVALMCLRAALESRALLGRAHAELAAGDLDASMATLRLSARWDAPLNAYADEAFDTLERLARAAEARGETERALVAYRAIHGAAMASRGAYLPQEKRLDRIDARIVQLARAADREGVEQVRGPALSYLSALRPSRPRALGIVMGWLGFAAWVGGAAVFLRRGVDAQGRLVRRVAQAGALLVLLGWLAFALGLRFA